jgi:glycosyltransferase involved in cell wall biosynthesis
MRIGMMVDLYKPHISGITNHIVLTKRFLETMGYDVFVFTFGEEEYRDDEPNVIRSPGLPLTDTGYYFSFRYSLAAQRLLRTMDIAHVHHPFLSGRLAIRYCKPRGIPIVFTNHTRYDLYAQFYLPIIPDAIGDALLQAYLPSFCRSIDVVVAPSTGMRDVLRRFGVDVPIEVIPNGVELTPFQSRVEAVDRSAIGFRDDDVVLIYTGRLGPEKNLNTLLRAFAGTAKTFDHVALLIVGEGPERENLEDRVQYMDITSRVCFTGLVPYDELPRYLAAADAFVTASVTEVHPLSVIEAMAAGLPVLGIESPGISDIVEDGVTGMVSHEDIAAFTAKMVRLVTEHEKRREMGENARQSANKYSLERSTQTLLSHYKRIIAGTALRRRGLRSWMAQRIDDLLK